nr:class I SAM-dependent methyltransferase [Massilia sp. H27-R4]
MQAARARLSAAGAMPGATVDQQLNLLDELFGFELGRFLLAHRGLNAWWTHHAVTWDPRTAAPMTALERRIVADLPATQATRERFGIFRRELQALLRPGVTMASVPCGLMGELLLLDYSAAPGARLVGVDLDQAALDAALVLGTERGLASQLTLRRQDAWAEQWQDKVDVLTSNGLNIYEPDDGRVTALYRSFHAALRPGGTLVTSFLTPPPTLSAQSPWKMSEIDPQALALQFVLFVRVIEVKWSAFRTHDQTRAQLEQAGFTDIRFVDDRASMFPTVVAHKPD